ncbi:MAG TPA: serine hydrolase domain-containing protein [Catenuloplanes sp.]
MSERNRTVVGGFVDPAMDAVRTAFGSLLESGAETGAALAVIRHGTVVVDLYGGWRDVDRRLPWTPDTLVNVFSVGKPVAALAILLLAERGRLELDDRVARHWPEFAAAGKERTTVRQVLSHTAGLPAFPVPRDAAAYGDWGVLVGDLAGAAPEWPPGTAAGEHALTYGHLVGELVRRVDGRPLGRFLAEEIAGPWRLDLRFGLSAADQRRCADLEYGDPDWPAASSAEPDSLYHRALTNPPGVRDLALLNSALWRSAEVPAVNLHTTATALARLYAALLAGGVLDGVRLFGDDVAAQWATPAFEGPDLVLGRTVRWTSGGMQLEDDGSWGMGGIGGSVGYVEPAPGLALAYVTRRLAGFDRIETLARAVLSAG